MKRILIIPDTHCPSHHRRSWNEMVKFAQGWKPNIIIHLGDFLDMYYASQHEKLAPAPALSYEFRVGNSMLDELDGLGAERRVFCMGNHETRLERIVRTRLPEVADIVPTVDEKLGLTARGWEVYKFGHPVRIGKVNYVHKLGTNSNQQIALRGGTNFVTGHTHRMEQVISGTFTGEQHVSIMAGWLGDANKIHFDYACPVTKAHTWTHGFVTGEMDAKGTTKFQLHPLF